MTEDDIRKLIFDILGGIAPEADLEMLEEDEEIREALDLDSMDFLNLISRLHEVTGLEIPEKDYSQLETMEGLVAYLRDNG